MTRLQRLAVSTFAVTVLLVAIGAFTRGSGSGFGCADRWPLCEDGLAGGFLPRPEFHMVVEWTHRLFANLAGLLLLVTAGTVWRRHRDDRVLRRLVVAGLVAFAAQALLGAAVVKTGLADRLVSVHLGLAMVVLALLAVITVETFFAGGSHPPVGDAADPSWRRWLAAGAAAVYTVILLGTAVHDRYVGGYPLVDDRLIPDLSDPTVALHLGHRVAVAVTALLLGWLAVQVVRRQRRRAEAALVHAALAAFVVNVLLGAAHVFTQVRSTGLVVAHLLVASLAWSGIIAAAALAHRADRRARRPEADARTTSATVEAPA
ncbi:MAG TPA: COX15/CtaA family protein [Nitriliruptorales bacterium]|nr:COX15/CtaA family protein [Nitriliruptorales bacterium]